MGSKTIKIRVSVLTAAAFIAMAFLLAGCQSLQRDRLFTSSADEALLVELGGMIIPLDKNPAKNEIAAARKKITSLEKSKVKDRNFEGRVAAWSGRLYLIEGKSKNAAEQLKKAESLFPGSVEGRILMIRLEKDLQKRKGLCEEAIKDARGGSFFGQYNEFNIELARVELELHNYREAVAAFDSAFPHLGPIYRSVYGEDRASAWQLRSLESGTSPKTANIAVKSAIAWDDVIELTKNETQLLRFLTGGRAMGNNELLRSLVERLIIPRSQDDIDLSVYETIKTSPSLQDAVLRRGAAWYIWHLLAENRADKSILARYSSRYPANNSPIPDLLRRSVFFDSVLGCIEREYMSLPDGRNFFGSRPVGGAEFLMMLKKIE